MCILKIHIEIVYEIYNRYNSTIKYIDLNVAGSVSNKQHRPHGTYLINNLNYMYSFILVCKFELQKKK